ncbi:type I restriction-modification system subunit M [bacterium]|nr:type I restriction-modification system subunit M [bacterium]
MSENKIGLIVNFLWSVAELLRDACKKSENQNFILPFTVLRRLDYALEETKEKVLMQNKSLKEKGLENRHHALCKASGYSFYNTSKYNFDSLLDDPENLKRNLPTYIRSFSPNVVEIFEKFKFFNSIESLDEVNRLYMVMGEFNKRDKCDLSSLTNHDMGYVFEQLIRRFNESVNENPGEHYTPRDAITLLVKVVASLDKDMASSKEVSRTVADCCVGTGGILSIFKAEAAKVNPNARVFLYGQELNPQTWAICRSDMMIAQPSGEDANNIRLGSTLSCDHFENKRFDYQFANPPYGTDWKVDKTDVLREAGRGFKGRFGAGIPGIADGQLLFLQHMIAHMNEPKDKPSYIGIFFNGSPLFTGSAGSGESEIRRWILKNDWLDSIIGLPGQIFYNTAIPTYLWIISNKKPKERKDKVMLIDASSKEFWSSMRKSLGDKRREITESHMDKILKLFSAREPGEHVKIFNTEDFCYRRIQVERPLRLNFCNEEERLERLKLNKTFLGLATSKKRNEKAKAEEEAAGRELQEQILDTLKNMPSKLFKDREVFQAQLKAALEAADLKLKVPVKKAILTALSERDETAEPCKGKNGNLEPDSELRDHENVPLIESIDEYMKREVLPYVPDAWVDTNYVDKKDGKVGKVGYEISFNRYFYVYQPPRELSEIDGELRELQADIMKSLQEVMG